MQASDVVGSAAGAVSLVCFVPQAFKIYKGDDTRDLSVYSFAAIFTAAVLWMSYGVMRTDWPLIATNAFQVLTIVYILAMIVRNRELAKLAGPETGQ